jgi:Pyruvate/2-oxoacid:ferredoxin oxidoreductase delta subunit
VAIREIVRIDEEKCDGCGLCVPACAEGAIQIINGKARLIDDSYCDGLGACLGECPQDAITIIKREADNYDEEAVEKHLAEINKQKIEAAPKPIMPQSDQPVHACPGSLVQSLRDRPEPANITSIPGQLPSHLTNWPVQLHLVPVKAPYFDNCDLLIAADCAPFAHANFHAEFIQGKVLLIGCPKLDDVSQYHQKLAQIFHENNIKSIEVAFMEVPCCFGLVQIIQSAVKNSGKEISVLLTKVGIRGEVQEKVDVTSKSA